MPDDYREIDDRYDRMTEAVNRMAADRAQQEERVRRRNEMLLGSSVRPASEGLFTSGERKWYHFLAPIFEILVIGGVVAAGHNWIAAITFANLVVGIGSLVFMSILVWTGKSSKIQWAGWIIATILIGVFTGFTGHIIVYWLIIAGIIFFFYSVKMIFS